MKLWDKGISVNDKIEQFTIGNDRQTDMHLAPWDVIGTMAHVKMLQQIGLITGSGSINIQRELKTIYHNILNDNFSIDEGVEDIHSQVEHQLTHKLGEEGKRIHSGRSRNDQVLLDIRLFVRHELISLLSKLDELFALLIRQSERYKSVLMPGYTHLQAAMPSSFGLWFAAYAENLADDVIFINSAYQIVNQNPLGSAAGYGSSFPIDRDTTTSLLGFDDLNYNVVYAQMGRGKTEKVVSMALSTLAGTLAKLAYDVCLFASQNFGFVSLPDELTTGSSIMPHKKNPDVFELIRGKCNKIQTFPFEVHSLANNLPSGYFRDYQVMKEGFLPLFAELHACIEMTTMGLNEIIVNEEVMKDSKYKFIFSVEEVNRKVINGLSFRDAYRQVSNEIQKGTFKADMNINHTHLGSIGNLCNDKIADKYEKNRKNINTSTAENAINKLLND
jgi:argininosuccinate lyase